MSDEEASVDAESGPSQSPLVTVAFQRNPSRKLKYLESEPKALGITQIGLSVFQISCASLFLATGLSEMAFDLLLIIASLPVIVAGGLAIAAQNLHLPTLNACLGMQIVACVACIFNMIITLIKLAYNPIEYSCWNFHYEDYSPSPETSTCTQVVKGFSHWYSESIVIQAALIAISTTLAAYCCKVVNCCSPPPRMPVITVQAPPAQQ